MRIFNKLIWTCLFATLSHNLYAIDCVLDPTDVTTIGIGDCNTGFDLSADQNFDVTISSGVTLDDGSFTIEIGRPFTATLTNNGTLTAGSEKAFWINSATITELINTNIIRAPQETISVNNNSIISTLNNSGSISAQLAHDAIYIDSTSTISSLINTNGVSALGVAIDNEGTISSLNNSGIISSQTSIAIDNRGTITLLTNNGGTISSDSTFDIDNNGIITTFDNSQGSNASNPISFNGSLPINYNIIISSISDYGQVVFTSRSGTTNFGVHSTSVVDTSVTYSSVIDGLTSAELNNTTTGTVSLSGTSYNWTLTDADSDLAWDLNFTLPGPSAADTQTSIQAIKGQLQGNLNSITAGANFANMNTYDCNFFDTKGGCFSFGNRYTDVQSPSIQSTSFVATGGYKINDHFRVAGFVDQNLNYNLAHNIDIENKGPLVGLIGVWNQNANQLGWQVKVANAYQSKDASIKRTATGTSEAGRGKTDIDTQSYVAELSYNYAATSSLLLRPYLAFRYAIVKQDGYTETGVDNPLTFSTIRDRSKTALVGLKFKKQLTDKVVGRGSVGVEHDLSHKTDNLEASGVSGLTTESFTSNLDKTRPVASIGADYYIDQTQRLSATAFYQELPYASTKSRTLYINYMLGF